MGRARVVGKYAYCASMIRAMSAMKEQARMMANAEEIKAEGNRVKTV